MSNVALRLLMRRTANAPSAMLREKVNTQSTGTTNTVTFTEPTALDSSHLLVALVHCSSAWTTPSGWTAVASGTYGILDQRILARQGNGSVNSIAVTQTSSAPSSVQLLAFSGFVSTTPLATGGGTNNTNTGGNVTLAGPSTTPAGTGVSIMHICSQGSMDAARTMTNGYTEVAAPAAPRISLSGKKDYTGTGTYSSLVDWTSSVSYFRWLAAVFDLV